MEFTTDAQTHSFFSPPDLTDTIRRERSQSISDVPIRRKKNSPEDL